MSIFSPIKPAGPALDVEQLRRQVLHGLHRPQKELPCKLFYDERGSQLFEAICELEEYYLTRTEIAIMQAHISEVAALLGRGCVLIEYGSGSSQKTRILLDALQDLVAYIPVDISETYLQHSAANLAAAYPGLAVLPVWADYTYPFTLPPLNRPEARKVAYFPGSTIGNFYPDEAIAFMQRIAQTTGHNGALLIGVDLKKDPDALHRAYNDHAGVTAAFNLNILARLNREFGADFQLDQFAHYAFYNDLEGRIEMHLISQQAQTVHIGEQTIPFKAGETILTEVSYKYTLGEFQHLAAQAGFSVGRAWTDAGCQFSVQYLIAGKEERA
jgi:dimethylhistidine N-methyltransferase